MATNNTSFWSGRCSRSAPKKAPNGLEIIRTTWNQFEIVLAETEGFEPSMRLYTPYSLSRGAPSATRSRFQHSKIISGLV